MRFLTLIITFITITSYGQNNDIFRIDSLPTEGVLLDKAWKWHAGDNPEWTKADFDDSGWGSLAIIEPMLKGSKILESEISWFKKTIIVDSALLNKPLIFDFLAAGAAEIYLNGELLFKNGQVSKDPKTEKTYWPFNSIPVNFIFNKNINDLSIRYSLTKENIYLPAISSSPPFAITIRKLDEFVNDTTKQVFQKSFQYTFLIGIFSVLGLLHFAFYYFFKSEKVNLLIGFTMLIRTFYFMDGYNSIFITSVSGWYISVIFSQTTFFMFYGLLLLSVHRYLKKTINKVVLDYNISFYIRIFLSIIFISSNQCRCIMPSICILHLHNKRRNKKKQ